MAMQYICGFLKSKVLFYNIVCKIYVFPNGLFLTICCDKRGNFHFSISILITSVNIHVAIHVINLKLRLHVDTYIKKKL